MVKMATRYLASISQYPTCRRAICQIYHHSLQIYNKIMRTPTGQEREKSSRLQPTSRCSLPSLPTKANTLPPQEPINNLTYVRLRFTWTTAPTTPCQATLTISTPKSPEGRPGLRVGDKILTSKISKNKVIKMASK